MAQLDITQIESKLETTKENVSYISEIADKVVGAYTRSLDSLMQEIYKNVVENDNASNNDLEKYFLRLTNTLYFMGEKLERLGLHDDVSKAQFREAYNNAYLDAQTSLSAQGKPTVAMLTISAENGSVNETVVNAIYARSYKTFKFKVKQRIAPNEHTIEYKYLVNEGGVAYADETGTYIVCLEN